MTNKVKFQLAATTHPGVVALKVANLETMSRFYQDVIGLKRLGQKENQVFLGTEDQQPLLILQKIEHPLPVRRKTGLYHVAFLLPTRGNLGDALVHYLKTDAPLIGASDHGYSEALYLNDPEGNGIEVYHDKPVEVWDIRENGEIIGVTIELDAEGVIAEATRTWSGFPSGTKVGHVHLKVSDLTKTELFYTEVLGLSLKSDFGAEAKFFAAGNYHHHIGSNTWTGRQLEPMAENDLGLAYYSFLVATTAELSNLTNHLSTEGVPFVVDSQGGLWVTDPNGIRLKFELEPSV